MSTDDLRDLIDEKITTNGEQEITGAILNNVLQETVDTLADGENLDEGSIKTANIADGAITTDKIEDHAVTKDKLGQNVSADLDWAVASNSYYRNSQAGDVAAKVITTYKNMSLIGGGSLKVTFEQANTADDATLNIDGKGAKPLYYNGKRVSSTNSWEANETVEIYYNNYNSGIYYAKRWMVEPVSVSQNTLSIGNEKVGELAGQLIENPEWVDVVTDNNDKILYGVKTDGKFYFGAGCPPQVVEYVTAKLKELEGDFTTLLNAKVDKVAGKSLIDEKFASSQSVVENPEWLDVTTDSENKILEGTKEDGTKVIGKDLQVNGQIINKYILQQIDSAIEQKLSNLDTDTLSRITATENPEWISVTTDSEGRVLGGRKPDGTVKECVGLEVPIIKVEDKIIGKFTKFKEAEFEKVKITDSLELTDDIVKSILSNNINDGSVKALYPKYEWEGYIANLASTKNLGAYNDRTYKPLVLQHFSDIHNSSIGCKRVIEFYNMYKEYIADILLSGDMVGSDWTVYDPAMYELDGYNDILKVIGNHDVVFHYGQPGEPATETECYQRYMVGIDNWGVNYTENKCYWYKDYIDNTGTKDNFNGEPFDSSLTYAQSSLVTYDNKFYKANATTGPGTFNIKRWEEITSFGIRLIGYDFEHQTEIQFTWLSQVLSDAITKGLAVILVTHGTPYLDDTTAEFFDTPFNGDEWLPKGVVGCASFRLVEIVSNFIDNGGEFICYLSGHIHTDKCGCFKTGTMVVDNVTYTNNHKQVFIAIGLARCDLTTYDYEATGQSEIDIQKIPYTKTWDLFNIESFDTETKTISVLRVGCDIDRLLRSRRSMVIDYKNCELLYSR